MSKSNQSNKETQPAPVLLQPENQNKGYEALFVGIDTGQTKLPMFQREFVWEKEQSARLIDSILKGFPIGTFILWRTKDELRSYKDVGNHKLPETPKGDFVHYILDGQQRITSLYAIRKGIRLTKDGKELDYRDIFINLDFDPQTDEQIVVTEREKEKRYVSVHRVLSSPFTDFFNEFSDVEILKRIEGYKGKLTNYQFSTITITDYPIEVACEVFSRINTGGKTLTVFEIMVAKTYDEARKFDLSEKYDELRDGSDESDNSLSKAKFETIPETIIMQCVAAIALGAVRSRDILKINRASFIENWAPMRDSLFTAIDFVRCELRVPVSQLLPYPALLVPLTYFFYKTKNKKPKPNQIKYLEQFFYWVGLTSRYSSATESKLSEDFASMDSIINGKMPSYPRKEMSVSPRDIADAWFSVGNAYCKSILCLLAYQQPRSFDTDGLVILDNSNLKISASRNYHHFFPKDYVQKKHPRKEANLLANITLIDGYSNKHNIGAQAPSIYLGKFAKENRKLPSTLKTHFIQNTQDFGVKNDNYDRFIKCRSTAIATALNEKLLSDLVKAEESEE